jgi:hypothetical protein
MNRSDVIDRLGGRVGTMLDEVERACGLPVQFQALAGSCVVAQYKYDPHAGTATVLLRSDWEDVDVAHELMHMSLELVEGFAVLAWRSGVPHTAAVESAVRCVRSYVDDEVVHSRLAQQGFVVDGEVLKSQLFDDIYTKVPRYLAKRRPKQQDGMAHLDGVGYGELRRSAFLVQAELVRGNYSAVLSNSHRNKMRRFVDAFRTHRSVEAAKADQVLNLFRTNDVTTVAGHREILEAWSQLEGLDSFVGASTYTKHGNGYRLPWP